MEQRAGLKPGKKSPQTVAKGGRQDAEAPGEGREALDTTLQLGICKGERISASEGKGQPCQHSEAALGSMARAGLHPNLIPAPWVFTPWPHTVAPGFTRGSPQLLAASNTGDVQGCGFNGSGEKIRNESCFLTSAQQLVTKCLGFGPSPKENFTVPLGLSPAWCLPSPSCLLHWGHWQPMPVLGEAAASHCTFPSPSFSTDDYGNRRRSSKQTI